MPSTSIATPTDATREGGAERLLLFALGATVYGCEMALVREIVPMRPPTRLPGAPPFVAGLLNLRGTIVTVIDVVARFGGGRVADDGSIMLVAAGGKTVGLAVDDVRDVQDIPPERFERAVGDVARDGIVRGVGHFDEGVVIVLDAAELVRQVMA